MTRKPRIDTAAPTRAPQAVHVRTANPLRHPRWLLLALAVALTASPAAATPAPQAAPGTQAERLHAAAVASFRQGRFPEAYGRFVALANAGHPASARYAVWMCEQGPRLFGSDWDCAPQEIEDWTRTAGIGGPAIAARPDLTPTGAPPPSRR